MRVLLVSGARPAQVNPLVGVAQRLRQGGHAVGWLALPAPPPQLERLDVERLVLPAGTLLPDPPPPIDERSLLIDQVDGWRGWLQAELLDGVPVLVGPLRQALRAFAPDVVGLEPTQYPAAIAAELEGLPYAGLSTSLQPLTPENDASAIARMVKSLASARAALFASFGLAPRFAATELLAPTFTAVFAPRAYVGEAPLPQGVELVGPSRAVGARGDEPAFPFQALAPGPFAYLSMGSLAGWQPKLFERVAQACARRALPLVLSCGLSPRARGIAELPGQVLAVEYAPQVALLQRASLCITHGSAGTVLEAVDAGVPLLVHPLGHDQPLEAARIVKAGVGRQVDLANAPLAEIDQVMGELLDPQGRTRQRAAALAAASRAEDGAATAAARLLSLAR